MLTPEDPTPDLESNPRNARGPNWALILFVLALLIAGGIAMLPDGGRVSPPRLIGSVFTASRDPSIAPRIYYVTQEERWERRFPGRGAGEDWYSVNFALYALHSRSAADGGGAASIELARIDDSSPSGSPEILGLQGDVLWMWNRGLEGRDLESLEKRWTLPVLSRSNPEFANVLPVDAKYFKVLAPVDRLVMKAKDTRYLSVDSATGDIREIDETRLGSLSGSKRASDAFDQLQPGAKSLSCTSISGWLSKSLTRDDRWFALLSSDERKALTKEPGVDGHPYGEVARSLYSAKFVWNNHPLLDRDEVLLDPAAVAAVSGDRFVMAGFLRRPNSRALWTPDSGESYFVIHKNELGANSPWIVTRLGLDGRVRWSRSTGLCDPGLLSDGKGTLVFTGYATRTEPLSSRPDLCVFIDEATGSSHTVDLTAD